MPQQLSATAPTSSTWAPPSTQTPTRAAARKSPPAPIVARQSAQADLDRQLRARNATLGARARRRLAERHPRLSRSLALRRARALKRSPRRHAQRRPARARAAHRHRSRDDLRPPVPLLRRSPRRTRSAPASRASAWSSIPAWASSSGTDPEVSLTVLRRLDELKARYRLPVLISVSRKSFIRKLANVDVAGPGPATLAAELFAAAQGRRLSCARTMWRRSNTRWPCGRRCTTVANLNDLFQAETSDACRQSSSIRAISHPNKGPQDMSRGGAENEPEILRNRRHSRQGEHRRR